MAGKLYYSRGDPDLLKLLVLWEAEENASRYELVEGGRYLGGKPQRPIVPLFSALNSHQYVHVRPSLELTFPVIYHVHSICSME